MSTPETAPPPPPPKARHSAFDKAQAALDISNRKIEKLRVRLNKALDDAKQIQSEIEGETIERDYFADHPALRTEPEDSTELIEARIETGQARVEADEAKAESL